MLCALFTVAMLDWCDITKPEVAVSHCLEAAMSRCGFLEA